MGEPSAKLLYQLSMKLRWLFLAFTLTLPAASLIGQETTTAPLVLVDRLTSQFRLQRIEDQKLIGQSDNMVKKIDLDHVVRWGWWQDNNRGPQILLQDGTVLIGDLTAIGLKSIAITIDPFGEISIPRSHVAAVIFRPATDVVERDRMLHDFLQSSSSRDAVWMFNGDRIGGIAVFNEATGTPNSSLQIGQSNIVVDVENVVAIECRRTNLDSSLPKKPDLWLGLRNGSRLAVAKLVTMNSMIECNLSSGFSLSTSSHDLWSQVTWIEPNSPSYVNLADYPNAGFKHIPFFSTSWPLGIDRNVLGGMLRSGGHPYVKGLGMHSASRAAYNLSKEFRWFEAEVAIDDRAGMKGSVVFRVYLDRAPRGQPSQWSLGYESPVVRGGTAPLPIRVDLTGAVRLALVVDFGDRGDECDYANWLHARLIP